MYDLGDFCSDVKTHFQRKTVNRPALVHRENLENLLTNENFVSTHCHKDAKVGVHVLYQDDELGFMVLNHVINKARKSPPHDHGESWAIYGQAVGHTDMSEFDRLDNETRERYR